MVNENMASRRNEGPATGKRAKGDVFWAATDRVAIDAVDVAM